MHTDRMTTLTRAALAAGALPMSLAAVATFAPASSDTGAVCGTWIAPEWDGAAERLERENADLLSSGGQLAETVRAYVHAARVNEGACAGDLETRRTVALALAALALVVPAGAVWVGRGRTAPTTASAPTTTIEATDSPQRIEHP